MMLPQSLFVSLLVLLMYSGFQPQPCLAAQAPHRAAKRMTKHKVKPLSVVHPAPSRGGQAGGVPERTPEEMQELSDTLNMFDNSLALSKLGDAAAKGSHWARAQTYYQQALAIWPDNSNALYGLGKCADAAGDTSSAVRYYRTATYSDNSPHTKWNTQTNDVTRLMEYVLLLNKAGQTPEALAVYHRAAHLLNYRDADANGGKPYLKVLLPTFDAAPDAAVYTPQRLQAMARVAISIEAGGFCGVETLPQVQEAVRLYPDSPITNFYLGKQLDRMQKPGAKAAYAKAASLGDEQVGAAAQEAMRTLR